MIYACPLGADPMHFRGRIKFNGVPRQPWQPGSEFQATSLAATAFCLATWDVNR